jgi:O-antigen/teichoic acid export membrane protein
VSVKQTLLRNLTWQGASQGVGVLCGMAVSLLLARYLGTAGFGAFNYVFAYIYFCLAISDLGVQTIVVREVAKDEARAPRIIGAMMVFRLIIGVSMAIVASIVAFLLRLEPGILSSILVFVWILPLNVAGLAQSAFQSRLQMRPSSITDMVSRVSGLLLVLAAIKTGSGLPGVFAALLGAEVIGAITALSMSRRIVRPVLSVDRALWREVLRSSLPLGGGVLLLAVVNRVDFLMLERMANLDQVGLYSAAYKITSLFERFPILISATLYPMMSQLAVSDRARLHSVYRRTEMHLAAIAIPAAVLISLFAAPTLRLFGPAYVAAATGLRVLVWSSVCLYLAMAGGHLLVSIGRERANLLTLLAGAVTNVVLNVFWIPRWGYVGAAMSTVAAFVVILVTTAIAVEVYVTRVPAVPAGDPRCA